MNYPAFRAGHGRRRDPGKEQFWRTILGQFASGGQSIRAFCRERQLSERSFHAWRRTLARRDAEASAATPAAAARPAFLPIRLAELAGPPIEIELAGGWCIRLRPPVDREALSGVLAALSAIPSRREA